MGERAGQSSARDGLSSWGGCLPVTLVVDLPTVPDLARVDLHPRLATVDDCPAQPRMSLPTTPRWQGSEPEASGEDLPERLGQEADAG